MPPEYAAARMLPDGKMTAMDGRVVRPGDYRHRKHLVLILFQAPPGALGNRILRLLSSRYGEILEENAEVLAVFPAIPRPPADTAAPDPWPFPVLVDGDGGLSGALSDRRAPGTRALAVHVADRYGEIFRSLDVAGGEPFPVEEILSWLRFLERLCPE